ncbi:MAG TPA: alpha/beta fold hydrolase [Ruminiclostridium sp.]|nr:alpha/beta fold hydrolase [Ruminiclostridium sp.]
MKKLPKRILIGFLIVGILLAAANIAFLAAVNRYMPETAASMPCRNFQNAGKVRINGFDIWYKEAGIKNSKPPVIVVHGGPGMSDYYFHNYLNFLEKDQKVYYYDQRGSGNSEIKPDLSLYSMDNMVKDLEQFRKDVVKEDKVSLVAHSFGGMVALEYMKKYEKQVASAVLVSPMADSANQTASAWGLVDIISKHGFPPKDPEEANKWFMGIQHTYFKNCFYNKNNEKVLDDMGYISFATLAATGSKLKQQNIEKTYAGIKTRTLIIYGEKEYMTTTESGQVKLHRTLSNSILKKFDHSGHFSFIEEPDKFASVVQQFLNNK